MATITIYAAALVRSSGPEDSFQAFITDFFGSGVFNKSYWV
jgi:hypothetical protein